MLVRLSLENFFFIKGEELYFDRGLNVITGETGTGKSLTVSSLLFLMGREGDYPEGTCGSYTALCGNMIPEDKPHC